MYYERLMEVTGLTKQAAAVPSVDAAPAPAPTTGDADVQYKTLRDLGLAGAGAALAGLGLYNMFKKED